jgi:hypothetical protein
MKRVLAWLMIGFTLIGSPALAVEEPKFDVVLKDGAFEVRDYKACIVAEVTVAGDQRAAAYKGFRLLAGYIFGGNRARQSIAMTAPVAQAPAGQTIAMTAPVSQTQADGAWVVRFTMPSAYDLDSLPTPNDPRVQLKAIPPARFAVARYSGIANGDNFRAKSEALLAFIKAHDLRAIGPATLAQYDPPWTPWFMRRNEVMIPVGR